MLHQNECCERRLLIEILKLNQQALGEVARSDARRVERLNDAKNVFHFRDIQLEELRGFFDGGLKVAVIVDIADQILPDSIIVAFQS